MNSSDRARTLWEILAGRGLTRRPMKASIFSRKKIHRKDKGQEKDGQGEAGDAPETEARIALRFGVETGREERTGQQENPQEEAHRERVEGPLDEDGAETESLLDISL